MRKQSRKRSEKYRSNQESTQAQRGSRKHGPGGTEALKGSGNDRGAEAIRKAAKYRGTVKIGKVVRKARREMVSE